ncbi:hypothetical protein GCM10009747_01230 [Agromyces humatus]|uniref:Uncharacterized protein n=1 Tax=Agromyces humatus TaxID=279573 RepID=A0ABN2K3X9_9MICO
MQVARRLGHHLVEEEGGFADDHRESRGRLAFGSEVRELHLSRLSGAPARPVWEVYNERAWSRVRIDNQVRIDDRDGIDDQGFAPAARQRCIEA